MQDLPAAGKSLFADHERSFEANRYVYPVLSRRAGGISIGVNLSCDKSCNFRCVYCQVNREEPSESADVETHRLRSELEQTIELVTSGRLYVQTKFRDTPAALRRLSDVALSGDGEPTAYHGFERVVDVCADVLSGLKLPGVKLVLITNGSLLHHEPVRRALLAIDRIHGEIWAKLDAGSEEYFRQIACTRVPWQQILENVKEAARARPIVVQSLFMRLRGELPALAEQRAYAQRLREIAAAGGQIKLVQIHTIARPTGKSWVTALTQTELDGLAELVREATGLPIAVFGP